MHHLSAVVVIAAAAALAAIPSVNAVLAVPITVNGPAIVGDSNTVTNYTYSLTQNQINTFTNFWLIVTIWPGYWGADTNYSLSRIGIHAYSTQKTFGFPNGTADSDGWNTNGQVVISLDPRSDFLFLKNAATMHFMVWNSGTGPTQPYNVSLYSHTATTATEASIATTIGQWTGTVYTGTVPCCGARWQMLITPNAHQGYYLIANVTALNNSVGAITLWEVGTAGGANTVVWNPTDTTRAASTCSGSSTCFVYVSTYWMEVSSPPTQQYSTQFQITYSYFLASNAPDLTGSGGNNTHTSTGLNAAGTTKPDVTIFAAATLLALALARRVIS